MSNHRRTLTCQSLRLGPKRVEEVQLRKKRKKKFRKRTYTAEGYSYKGCLEYEDALGFLRRKELAEFKFIFERPKPKRTPRAPLSPPGTPSPSASPSDDPLSPAAPSSSSGLQSSPSSPSLLLTAATTAPPNLLATPATAPACPPSPASPTPVTMMSSAEYEDLLQHARARRTRQRRQRISRIRSMHVQVVAPVEPIDRENFPDELTGPYFRVGVSEMKGKRPYMEDRHCISLKRFMSFLGVFDGHVGFKAAELVRVRLIKILQKKLQSKQIQFVCPPGTNGPYITPSDAESTDDDAESDIESESDSESEGEVEEQLQPYSKPQLRSLRRRNQVHVIIRDSFLCMHEELKAEGISMEGCCATAVLIVRNKCWIGNVGDSKAVMFKRNGSDESLTVDHDPKNPDEIARIEAMGGRVTGGRVNGLLNVTRSLGDNYATLVIHDPDVCFFRIRPKVDRMLIIASDGLWNFVTMPTIRQTVGNENDPRVAAQKLRNKAFSSGSTDNITVVVCMFEESGEAPAPVKSLHAIPEPSIGARISSSTTQSTTSSSRLAARWGIQHAQDDQ